MTCEDAFAFNALQGIEQFGSVEKLLQTTRSQCVFASTDIFLPVQNLNQSQRHVPLTIFLS